MDYVIDSGLKQETEFQIYDHVMSYQINKQQERILLMR